MSTDMSTYDKVFSDERYNLPDPQRLEFVRSWLKSKKVKDVVDIGCGRGNYLIPLSKEFNTTGVDPSAVTIKGLKAEQGDILSYKGKHEAFYCMDVLEHLQLHELVENIKALSKIAPVGLLGIANHSDMWNGVELHTIQEDSSWWSQALKGYFNVRLLQDGQRYFIFEVSRV